MRPLGVQRQALRPGGAQRAVQFRSRAGLPCPSRPATSPAVRPRSGPAPSACPGSATPPPHRPRGSAPRPPAARTAPASLRRHRAGSTSRKQARTGPGRRRAATRPAPLRERRHRSRSAAKVRSPPVSAASQARAGRIAGATELQAVDEPSAARAAASTRQSSAVGPQIEPVAGLRREQRRRRRHASVRAHAASAPVSTGRHTARGPSPPPRAAAGHAQPDPPRSRSAGQVRDRRPPHRRLRDPVRATRPARGRRRARALEPATDQTSPPQRLRRVRPAPAPARRSARHPVSAVSASRRRGCLRGRRGERGDEINVGCGERMRPDPRPPARLARRRRRLDESSPHTPSLPVSNALLAPSQQP